MAKKRGSRRNAQPSAALKAMILTGHSYWPDPQTGDDGLPIGLAFISAVIRLPTGMSEDSDATCTFQVKCHEANAVVRRSAAAVAAVICTMVKM